MKGIIFISVIIVAGVLFLSAPEHLDKKADELTVISLPKKIDSSNAYEVQRAIKEYQNEDIVINNINKEFPIREVEYIIDAANRNGLDLEQLVILAAIRKAENGGHGKEFGIMNKKANNFDKQAGWCAATIKKNYQRWIDAGRKGEYIDFLGSRYCPIGAENDPTGLNHNWIPNVKYWVNRLSR